MIDSHPARTLDSLSYQYLHTEVSKWSNSIVGIYIPRLTCVCIGSCLYLNYVVLQIGLFTILLFLPFSLSMLVVRWYNRMATVLNKIINTSSLWNIYECSSNRERDSMDLNTLKLWLATWHLPQLYTVHLQWILNSCLVIGTNDTPISFCYSQGFST